MDKITKIKLAFLLKRHEIALKEGDEKKAKLFWDKYQEILNGSMIDEKE